MRRRTFAALLLGTLTLWTSVAGAEQQFQAANMPATFQLRRFVVTLVLGEVQAGQWSEFTPAAKRALDDLKGFLPYKTYKLLDTDYRIGIAGPSLKLAGLSEKPYELILLGKDISPTATKIDMFRLVDLPTNTQGMRTLIDTSFTIEIGETVVVGTSKIDGNRALLALVSVLRQ